MANPKSPIRLTRNALVAAALALSRSYQYPMSRYEHSPTISQKMKSWSRLSEMTSMIMLNTNSGIQVKNRGLFASWSMYPTAYMETSVLTPVTTSSMTTVSASVRKAISMSKPPLATQV